MAALLPIPSATFLSLSEKPTRSRVILKADVWFY
jgi:hypothetical protein